MEFKKTLPLPQTFSYKLDKTQDSKYFKSFKSSFIKEYAPITSINFSNSNPSRYAVTSATRVQVYNPKSNQLTKTISRFKDVARSGEIRNDGKLLIAGDDSGLIQIFDLNSRAILRSFDCHQQPVHHTSFHPFEHTKVLSTSDDCTVVLNDIPTQSILNKYDEHSDYVRCAQFSPSSPNLLISGSYDNTVKLWDDRMNHSVMTMDCGQYPVDSLTFLPGSQSIASGSGPIIRIWDILSGGRCRKAFSNHQKTITNLKIDGFQKRLFSGSLDHMVKIYDLETFNVTHTMRFSSPVLSLGISPDNSNLVAGLSDGTLAIRKRVQKNQELNESIISNQVNKSGALNYNPSNEQNNKNISSVISKGNLGNQELKIESIKRVKLKQFEKYLKNFQYSLALDSVFKNKTPPSIIFSLILELYYRNGLKQALSNRDDIGLEPILKLLIRFITDIRFSGIAIDTANTILEIYGNVAGQSPLIDNLLNKLRKKVDDELILQNDLILTKSTLDMIFQHSKLN